MDANKKIGATTSTSRQILEIFELENKYIFHGSKMTDLEVLVPHQANNYINGVNVPDGDPAVFGTTSVDYAILMALINIKNCPKGYRAGAEVHNKENKMTLNLRATKGSIEQLNTDSSGWVYIFERSLFSQVGESLDYISKQSVVPIEKIVVYKTDLPSNIEIIEE